MTGGSPARVCLGRDVLSLDMTRYLDIGHAMSTLRPLGLKSMIISNECIVEVEIKLYLLSPYYTSYRGEVHMGTGLCFSQEVCMS